MILIEKQKRKRQASINQDPVKLKKRVIEKLCEMAFDDIGNYLDYSQNDEGEIELNIKDSNSIKTSNIAEVTQNKSGFKFKLYNKENALVRLGNYLGLWREHKEEEAEDLQSLKEQFKPDGEQEN